MWKQYIQLVPELTLTNNFISYAHYMTEELLVHAGINHLLCLYLLFPHLNTEEYSLRNTGNRGIEAFHSIFRGGTSTLPITGANLSFQEFLTLMNKAVQVSTSEHELKKIEGNTIVASKKRRKTFAKESAENTSSATSLSYKKPDTYDEFVKMLCKACRQGEAEAKELIEKLAPHMAKTLKQNKKWEKPNISIDYNSAITLIKSNQSEIVSNSPLLHDKLISFLLGPVPQPCASNTSEEPELASAFANLLTDLTVSDDDQLVSKRNVRKVLKGLQPYREKPSKDRAKRFAAGELPLNSPISEEHDLLLYSYWCVRCTTCLESAKLFLLGQVLCITQNDKPVDSCISNCPNAFVVLYVYKFDSKTSEYTAAGRSALMKASKVLIVEATNIDMGIDSLKFDHSCIPNLNGYSPFHDDLDLNSIIMDISSSEQSENEDDPFIVEGIIKKTI